MKSNFTRLKWTIAQPSLTQSPRKINRSLMTGAPSLTSRAVHSPKENGSGSANPTQGFQDGTSKATKKSGKGKIPDQADIEAKRKARAEKKEREAQEKAQREKEALAAGFSAPAVDAQGRPLYKPRDWAWAHPGKSQPAPGHRRLRVLSWNMLAQGLIRRKLFPGSDAMRWKDREAGLTAELVGHQWDIGCFQEVDRWEHHGKTLEKAGFACLHTRGYAAKKHGLTLAWRTRQHPSASSSEGQPAALFQKEEVAVKTVFFDDAEVSPGRTAGTIVTRNLALFAAVRFQHKDGATAASSAGEVSPKGVILATTHLFWHPMYAYERVRQNGIMIRELDAFRKSNPEWADWPTILAGDFNDQPDSLAYALLTGGEVSDAAKKEWLDSRVVHKSIDERERKRREGTLEEPVPIEQQKSTGTTEASEKTNGSATAERAKTEPNDGAAEDQDADLEAAEDEEEEGDEETEAADDRVLKNTRPPTKADQLLTFEEVKQLYDLSRPFPSTADVSTQSSSSTQGRLISAYSTCLPTLLPTSPYGSETNQGSPLFSSPTRGRERHDQVWSEGSTNPHQVLKDTPAGREPMWTLYSSLFSLTLDFIFLFPHRSSTSAASPEPGQEAGTKEDAGGMVSPSEQYPKVTRLLRLHKTETIQEGLPRKGLCLSDHMAIGAELEI